MSVSDVPLGEGVGRPFLFAFWRLEIWAGHEGRGVQGPGVKVFPVSSASAGTPTLTHSTFGATPPITSLSAEASTSASG